MELDLWTVLLFALLALNLIYSVRILMHWSYEIADKVSDLLLLWVLPLVGAYLVHENLNKSPRHSAGRRGDQDDDSVMDDWPSDLSSGPRTDSGTPRASTRRGRDHDDDEAGPGGGGGGDVDVDD